MAQNAAAGPPGIKGERPPHNIIQSGLKRKQNRELDRFSRLLFALHTAVYSPLLGFLAKSRNTPPSAKGRLA